MTVEHYAAKAAKFTAVVRARQTEQQNGSRWLSKAASIIPTPNQKESRRLPLYFSRRGAEAQRRILMLPPRLRASARENLHDIRSVLAFDCFVIC
jgi:hypothetical protein